MESGFVSLHSDKISFAMNLYGHQQFYWDQDTLDPRLVGSVPFWMCYGRKSLIPAIPYSHGFFTSKPRRFPLIGKCLKLLDKTYQWMVNKPYASGFLSYLQNNRALLLFQGYSQAEIKNFADGFVIKGFGHLWFIPPISLKWFWFFFLTTFFKNKFIKKQTVHQSSMKLVKTLIATNEFFYIEDEYEVNKSKGICVVPFTLRTFSDVKVSFKNGFVQFISSIHSTVVAVSITAEEELVKIGTTYASTGEVFLWEIRDNSSENFSKKTFYRIITGGTQETEIQDINYYKEKIKRMKSGIK